jgi:hypothetical protein
MNRYLDRPSLDGAGLRGSDDLAEPLPYNLRPQDAIRMVEDLYDLLHDLNVQASGKGYDRLEELLDPAGFSGFISRAVTDGLHKFSRELVRNTYPGGYPDLLPRGVYPHDRAQRSERGGLEIKASRFDASWQSHSPRSGWFCIVQFAIDRDPDKAVRDRDPTTVVAIMMSELGERDWSWQPAAEGKKRTGTASVKATGRARLRANAVWVDPKYEATHQSRLRTERQLVFRENATDYVLEGLKRASAPIRALDLAEELATAAGLPADAILSKVKATLPALAKSGYAIRTRPGFYLALEGGSVGLGDG